MNAVSPLNELSAAAGLPFLPVFFGLRGRKALLIGGGETARPKLDLLRRAGARVEIINDAPMPRHFSGALLAIDASDDLEINRRSVQLARAAGVPINVVDRPALCDFILPAILDRGPVVVAVSTGGLSPAIARLIRQRLELAIPHGIGRLALLASRFRESVARMATAKRMLFWDRLFEGDAARLIARGQTGDAIALAETLLESLETEPESGAALQTLTVDCNDPDLLTVRAARLIRTAEVIYHEPGIAAEILELSRRDALKIAVAERATPTASPRPGVQLLLRVGRVGD